MKGSTLRKVDFTYLVIILEPHRGENINRLISL